MRNIPMHAMKATRMMVLAALIGQLYAPVWGYEIPDGPTEDQSFEAHFLNAKQKVTEGAAALAPNGQKNETPVISDGQAGIEAMDGKRVGLAARFITIQPGTFQMGSPSNESGRYDNEIQHSVTLTRGFELQATAVTQMQYFLVMGRNPSYFHARENCDQSNAPGANNFRVINGAEICVDHPVEQVSWEDAQEFIRRLNELQNQYTYRLPTEAEREYATRAGTLSSYSFGSSESDLGDNAWYYGNSNNRTHAVATKRANPWGLYDMHGNVWEWVQDWYGDYPNQSVTDPKGPNTGSYRVIRGGSWGNSAGGLRSAFRYYGGPGGRSGYVGFRLARSRR